MWAYIPDSNEMKKSPRKDYPVFSGKVLVCEYDLTDKQVIRELLLRVGITPVIASNGMLGVELARKHIEDEKPFNLILMNVDMPVMDGLTAVKKLAEIGNTSPVIAFTSNSALNGENCSKLGISGYLEKPYSMKNLCICLSKYLTVVKRPD